MNTPETDLIPRSVCILDTLEKKAYCSHEKSFFEVQWDTPPQALIDAVLPTST